MRVPVNQVNALVTWVCSGMHPKAWLKAGTHWLILLEERCPTFELACCFQSLAVDPTIDKRLVMLLSLGKIMHTPVH